MTARAERVADTRARILDAARALLDEGRFHDVSMQELATRAGVTRVTLYRTFGSKRDLLDGIFWDAVARARLDRVDAAHANPDVRAAVRQVLRANCEMFANLGDAMPLVLELARGDVDLRAIVDATYYGRRVRAMEALAARVVDEGAGASGWTKKRIADALVVLSSHEAFDTLTAHCGYSPRQAADLLHRLAGAFLVESAPRE